MFMDVIAEFRDAIKTLTAKQEQLQEQVSQILEKVTHSEITVKQTSDKFAACAKGFYQIKEAIEVLHENLDESTGKLTELTWND